MKIGKLIKAYSDCKNHLLSVLSYLIEEISNSNDTFSEFSIEDFDYKFALLKRVYKDIRFLEEDISLLEKLQHLEEKGV